MADDDFMSVLHNGLSEKKRLYLAVNNNDKNDLKLLLSRGIDVNAAVQEQSGFTALHIACMQGHGECVQILIDANANMTAKNHFEITPLVLCLKYAKSDCLRLLLKAGCEVDQLWSAKQPDGSAMWNHFDADMLRVAVAATPSLSPEICLVLGSMLPYGNYDGDFVLTCLFAGCITLPEQKTAIRTKFPNVAEWLDTEFKRPLSLVYSSILTIRRAIKTNCFHAVPLLMLPARLQHLLLLCHPMM